MRPRSLLVSVQQILHSQAPLPAVLAVAGAALLGGAARADQLEEVVVTATRRDTTTEDIPYSISAISEKTLEDDHVTSLADLTKQIAGVTFVDQGPLSRSNIVLRGINANGTDHPSVTTVAPVSTYIGETPIFIPLQIEHLNRVGGNN
jgi:outer membrane receptor protein involved in Fe transport